MSSAVLRSVDARFGVQTSPVDSDPVAYSAQGTKLNRKGIETRQRVLETAVRLLAEGHPEAFSANLIAREAGVTWGTIQHQFGDADGVWAAVLDFTTQQADEVLALPSRPTSVRVRVRAIVETLWHAYDSDVAKAVQNLRRMLPLDHATLAAEYPETATRLRSFDSSWADQWSDLFTGLPTSRAKLRKVGVMLPGAVRGLHDQAEMTGYSDDVEVSLECLVAAVTCYLS